MRVQACDIPNDGLLQAYVGQGETYTDCFEVVVPQAVDLPALIEAFYTTWLFRLERFVLTIGLRRRITDADVRALGAGADSFAAWTVEARRDDQILLCDLAGSTRSFLAVEPSQDGATRLIFGSAVVAPEGKPLGRVIKIATPLHRLYSVWLLEMAARKLQRS